MPHRSRGHCAGMGAGRAAHGQGVVASLYGVFRNTVDHHNVDVPWHEAEAVIGMVNWALLRLSAMSSEWTLQGGAS